LVIIIHSEAPDPVTTGLNPDAAADLQHNANADLSIAVGAAIRRAREAGGLSMRALARLAEISQPFLSQVERGATSPSLFTLYRIAHALGIAPSELMPATSNSREILVLRTGEGRRMPVSDVPGAADGRLLSAGAETRLEVVEYRAKPGQDLGGWFESNGEMTVYLADGALEITLEGHGAWELAAGDSISHPSDIRHRWRVLGDAEACILLSVAHSPEAAAP
jgi:transcriptional regulator with XRE-family HTH domain